MPFHFCGEEIMMFMGMIPFVGIYFKKFYQWYYVKVKNNKHGIKHGIKNNE